MAAWRGGRAVTGGAASVVAVAVLAVAVLAVAVLAVAVLAVAVLAVAGVAVAAVDATEVAAGAPASAGRQSTVTAATGSGNPLSRRRPAGRNRNPPRDPTSAATSSLVRICAPSASWHRRLAVTTASP